MKTNERLYQSVIGVLVIIVLFLVWWISSHPGSGAHGAMATSTDMSSMSTAADEGPTSSMSPTIAPSTEAGGESVSVGNQSAGMSVVVSSVTLSQPGWVAIRDSSGRTLGAAWFDTGTHTDVSVPLLRATAAGQNYQVLLYADNGDHQFDLHTDTLITNADGSVPGTTFSAQ